ncbi:MAG: Gldg family protein, partial [Myxococcota bacterium]
MELGLREVAARGAFGLAVVLVGAARVLDELLGAPFGSVVEAMAGVSILVAGVAWSTEDRPLSVRAGDLAGLSVVAFTLLAHQLVHQGAVREFLTNGALGITFATFVGATTYRASRTPDVASPMVGLAGMGLLFVGVAHGWIATSIDGLPTALLVGGAGLAVLYVVLDRTQVGATVQSRPFRFLAGATLLVALSALLGVASYTLAVRHDKTWDWTGDRSFSLSDHAIRTAEGLDFDVQVIAFVRGSTPGRTELEGLVGRFAEHTQRLQVEWVDPLQEPLRAKNAEVTGDQGTVILRGKDRERRLEGEITEEELTRELVLLGSDEDHEVCWTMGHGEPDPDDEFGADGLGAARLQLEGMNYQVKKVTPATTGIPRTCRVVVVARPTTEWFPYEREALAAYVAEGGRLLVLIDAGEVPEFAASLERFGVIVGDDVVLDLNLKNQMLGVNDPSFVVLSAENFGQHAITRNLSAAVVMPIARSVKASTEDLPGIEARDLLHTSADAWGETDLQSAQPTPDPNTEVVGEVPVVAVVEI